MGMMGGGGKFGGMPGGQGMPPWLGQMNGAPPWMRALGMMAPQAFPINPVTQFGPQFPGATGSPPPALPGLQIQYQRLQAPPGAPPPPTSAPAPQMAPPQDMPLQFPGDPYHGFQQGGG